MSELAITHKNIRERIIEIPDEHVLLDRDVAMLYECVKSGPTFLKFYIKIYTHEHDFYKKIMHNIN